MALFGSRKKADVATETSVATPKKAPAKRKSTQAVATTSEASSTRDLSWVITKPRITEKAALLGDKNIYVFEVSTRATKQDVKDAVVTHFKVVPTRINIVNRSHRTTKSRARNRLQTVSGQKKAHVFLKKGDTINLI
jgi:large subunit ribosomal protein L23